MSESHTLVRKRGSEQEHGKERVDSTGRKAGSKEEREGKQEEPS